MENMNMTTEKVQNYPSSILNAVYLYCEGTYLSTHEAENTGKSVFLNLEKL